MITPDEKRELERRYAEITDAEKNYARLIMEDMGQYLQNNPGYRVPIKENDWGKMRPHVVWKEFYRLCVEEGWKAEVENDIDGDPIDFVFTPLEKTVKMERKIIFKPVEYQEAAMKLITEMVESATATMGGYEVLISQDLYNRFAELHEELCLDKN